MIIFAFEILDAFVFAFKFVFVFVFVIQVQQLSNKVHSGHWTSKGDYLFASVFAFVFAFFLLFYLCLYLVLKCSIIPYNCHFFYTDTIFGEYNLHPKNA